MVIIVFFVVYSFEHVDNDKNNNYCFLILCGYSYCSGASMIKHYFSFGITFKILSKVLKCG